VPENVVTPDADRNRGRQMPDSSVQDPDYELPNSPRSRRELSTTSIAPPVTGSRARVQLQENSPVQGATCHEMLRQLCQVMIMCENMQIVMINFMISSNIGM